MTLTSVKLLVVDDHDPTLKQWQAKLQSQKYEVLIASRAQQAFEIACQSQPDLIISDLDMPEMNGFQLLTLLKETEITEKIPFIVCSGTTDKMSEYLAMTLGAIAYLKKPLNLSEIKDLVIEHCTPHSMTSQGHLLASS